MHAACDRFARALRVGEGLLIRKRPGPASLLVLVT